MKCFIQNNRLVINNMYESSLFHKTPQNEPEWMFNLNFSKFQINRLLLIAIFIVKK